MRERNHNDDLDDRSGRSPDLNDQYRDGGNPVESRDYTRDMLSEMSFAHHRPDVLANQLRTMGITPNGDDPED